MKYIDPSFEIISQEPGSLMGLYDHIEKVARTCYKSEDRIQYTGYPFEDIATVDLAGNVVKTLAEDTYHSATAEGFVQRLVNSHHGAMLEHATVYLTILEKTVSNRVDLQDIVQFYIDNPFSEVVTKITPDKSLIHYITTNYRVVVENHRMSDMKYFSTPQKHHLRRYTVRFITDRGVANEFVRHRIMSFGQESTRFCVTGDTIPTYKDPHNHYTIEELYNDKISGNKFSGILIEVLNLETGILEYSPIKNIFYNGVKKVYKLTTKLGYSLKCTADHKIYTPTGWKELQELSVNDAIYVNGVNLMTVCGTCHQRIHHQSLKTLHADTVITIEEVGELPVYDLEIDKYHNYVANGIIVHNCTYSKSKFGGEISVIRPWWMPEEMLDMASPGPYSDTHGWHILNGKTNNIFDIDETTAIMTNGFIDIEKIYTKVTTTGENGTKGKVLLAQDARHILPLGLKTELVVTGFLEAWQKFFNLRYFGTTGAPHPEAKRLAEPLYNEFTRRHFFEN